MKSTKRPAPSWAVHVHASLHTCGFWVMCSLVSVAVREAVRAANEVHKKASSLLSCSCSCIPAYMWVLSHVQSCVCSYEGGCKWGPEKGISLLSCPLIPAYAEQSQSLFCVLLVFARCIICCCASFCFDRLAHFCFSAFRCTYNSISNVLMQNSAIQTQALTISECQDLCDRWENLPFTSSQCVGFNYNKIEGYCFLYDRELPFQTDVIYDYYERTCPERNLTGDWQHLHETFTNLHGWMAWPWPSANNVLWSYLHARDTHRTVLTLHGVDAFMVGWMLLFDAYLGYPSHYTA